MKKKLTAIFLSVLALSLCAVSCEKGVPDPVPPHTNSDVFPENIDPGTNTEIETETENEKDTDRETESSAKNNAFDSIESEDFGGIEFVLLSTDPQFCHSDDGKGIIGAELFARNRAIEEKFNIKITCIPADEYSVKPALQTGEALPDLIYASQDTIASCGGSGLLMNVYSVPYFSYKAEHTQPELLGSLSQNDTTFGVYGDAAYDERYVWCVYYNKAILNYLGFSDPYEMVENGSWTWDMFLAISEGAMLDVDQNGKMQASVDRFGYSSSMNTTLLANAAFASFGKQFFTRDEEGFFKMNFASSEEDDYVAVLRDICVSNKAKYPAANPGASALDAFNEGRLAFFCEKLTVAASLAYSPVEWGILPMPKRNEQSDRYYSWVDSSVCGYAVPQGARDSALSGKVLDAICAYESSYGTEVVEKAWTYHYLPDERSRDAMRDIVSTPVYDAAYAFGEGMADFSMASYALLQSVMEKDVNFSYLYNQNEKPFSAFVRNKFVH